LLRKLDETSNSHAINLRIFVSTEKENARIATEVIRCVVVVERYRMRKPD
jgi:hypothetical protein